MRTDPTVARVFITQERPTFNYSTATQFGELVTVTLSDVSNVPNSQLNEELYEDIHETLDDFDPHKDYLLPSGSPLVTGLCFARLVAAGHKFVRVLRYDSRSYTYAVFPLRLQENN